MLAVARPNWKPTEKKSSAVDSSKELPLVHKVQKPKKSETDVKAEQADWIKKYMAQQAEVFSLDLVNRFDIHVCHVLESTRSSNSNFSQYLIIILTLDKLSGPLPCTNIFSGCAGGFRWRGREWWWWFWLGGMKKFSILFQFLWSHRELAPMGFGGWQDYWLVIRSSGTRCICKSSQVPFFTLKGHLFECFWFSCFRCGQILVSSNGGRTSGL